MKIFSVAAAILLFAVAAMAQTTNALSDTEIRGYQLAQQLLEQRPAENFTNTGLLQIRDAKGKRVEIPVRFETSVTKSNWQADYRTQITEGTNRDVTFGRTHYSWLTIIHSNDGTDLYRVPNVNPPPADTNEFFYLTGSQLMAPFATSDFWFADLGLEFLHWPEQKILRGESTRLRFCKVLESANPNPSTNGYSRVQTWIDNETLGLVQAKAYDAQGKLLKEFYPKDIKKVNGQWQLESMEIYNVQTRSRTRIVFDLKTK